MYPVSLRVDERYAVELMKTTAIAERQPFDDRYPLAGTRCNSRGERVLVTINGKDYSRADLLEATNGMYACVAFAS
jgi:hypothetical protein